MWLALGITLAIFALPNVASPGLYYDEALFAGHAKDFLTEVPRPHVLAPLVIMIFGRPLPILIQSYLGGLKSWLLIPSFAIFGANLTVLRLTDLSWSLIALLFFMLWTRKLFGLPAALVAAAILAFDPAYFFLSVLDWGPFVPTFLCRVCGFYFFLRWSRRQRRRDGVLAALCFGLGIFNKIDFVVILLGCGMALFVTYRNSVLAVLRSSWRQVALYGVVFMLAASPMVLCLIDVLEMAMGASGRKGDFTEKLNTTLAMYDGSYIFRLMQAGGRFDRMYDRPSAIWSPFGVIVILAAVIVGVRAFRSRNNQQEGRSETFLVLGLVFVTVGALLVPGAARMHHTTLVYPLPHLTIAVAAVALWKIRAARSLAQWALRGSAIAIVSVVLLGHLSALWRTQQFIEATGGRGRWSNSLDTFCNDVKNEQGLAIVSLDWGFNEQLCFLTDDNLLTEPFWNGRVAVTKAAIYLVHPPEYALFPEGLKILQQAKNNPERGFSIRSYKDRQGNVAFYAIRYKPRRK